MKPFRVSITLSGPMAIPRHPLHLDGLLAAVRVKRAEAAGDTHNGWDCQHDLPLQRYTASNGQWVFMAGILRGERQMEPFMVPLTSRHNLVRTATARDEGLVKFGTEVANLAGGPFKGSFFMIPAQWVTTLVADGVGDLEVVRDLLSEVEFVGPRRGIGMGRVKHVEVVDVSDANWMDRAMPEDTDIKLPGPVALTFGGLRPPYWERPKHQRVLMPLAS